MSSTDSGPSTNGSAPDHMREATKDAPIGGQAVLEGVMMRGISTWAVSYTHLTLPTTPYV